jgi:aryl-alcohol dehydrogenase-like predicted oxidoreductase
MRYESLGPFENISRLTLGGGGLGQAWGETTREEAIATLHAAIDAGVNLLDTAPIYLNCEQFVGEAFAGQIPEGVRITTKCMLGEPERGSAAQMLEASLNASFAAMRIEHADIFFLHTNICDDEAVYAFGNEHRHRFATPWSLYADEVVPAMEALKQSGRIGAWGITGIGVPKTIIKALNHAIKPDIVQAITNVLDSPGALRRFAERAIPREIIATANARGVGVMGIRAVQAGALTAGLDRPLKDSHPEMRDYHRAEPFRALCAELDVDPALLAHRYALDMEGVDTVVLGVKNRAELKQCIAAETLGPLPASVRAQLDAVRAELSTD